MGENCTMITMFDSEDTLVYVFPTSLLEGTVINKADSITETTGQGKLHTVSETSQEINVLDVLNYLVQDQVYIDDTYNAYMNLWLEFVTHPSCKPMNRAPPNAHGSTSRFSCMGGDVIHYAYAFPRHS